MRITIFFYFRVSDRHSHAAKAAEAFYVAIPSLPEGGPRFLPIL